MRYLLGALGTLGLGLAVAGCGGGGGGSGSTAAPITGLSGALPSAERSPNGYVFSALHVGTTPDGALVALAPVGTATAALREPSSDLVRLDGTVATSEATFPAPGSSLAAVSTSVWAATADRAAQGSAGRVYQRGVTATWSVVLDPGAAEAYVAATASGAVALAGGPGQVGRVWRLGAGAPVEVAALQSATPTAAAVLYDGALYVGGTGNDPQGGGARLYRLRGGAVEPVALPMSQAQAGQRQVVTAMLTVDAVAGAAPRQVLLLAVGMFDLTTGAGQGGWVLLSDGAQFEVLSSFGGEAPTSLAWLDKTGYAGTTGGRIVFRDTNGQWVDEGGIPAGTGAVLSLLARGGTLLAGCKSAQGPRLLTRAVGAAPAAPPASGGGGGTTPPPAGGGGTVPPAGRDVFYQSDVKFLIQSACISCHADPNNRAAYSVYSVSRLPDDFASYQSTKDHVDTTKPPADSLLLRKITNQTPHVGGAQVRVGDSTYNLVYNWILQGARRDVTGSNPPFNYFTEVKPTVDKGCFGCHFNGAGGYSLAGDYLANYNELLQELDLANPRNSRFIRAINGQMAHTGGTAFAPNSAEENRIVAWIVAGRPFQ